ncbi:MAG: hypothetical protein R2845_00295 [Thermomicrobiales bacterium]
MTDRDTQSNMFEFPADGLDLALTAAPVAWGKGRWPSVDWIGDELIQVRQSQAGDDFAVIRVRQPDEATIVVSGFPIAMRRKRGFDAPSGGQGAAPHRRAGDRGPHGAIRLVFDHTRMERSTRRS